MSTLNGVSLIRIPKQVNKKERTISTHRNADCLEKYDHKTQQIKISILKILVSDDFLVEPEWFYFSILSILAKTR